MRISSRSEINEYRTEWICKSNVKEPFVIAGNQRRVGKIHCHDLRKSRHRRPRTRRPTKGLASARALLRVETHRHQFVSIASQTSLKVRTYFMPSFFSLFTYKFLLNRRREEEGKKRGQESRWRGKKGGHGQGPGEIALLGDENRRFGRGQYVQYLHGASAKHRVPVRTWRLRPLRVTA